MSRSKTDEYKQQLKQSRQALIAGLCFMCSCMIVLALLVASL